MGKEILFALVLCIISIPIAPNLAKQILPEILLPVLGISVSVLLHLETLRPTTVGGKYEPFGAAWLTAAATGATACWRYYQTTAIEQRN